MNEQRQQGDVTFTLVCGPSRRQTEKTGNHYHREKAKRQDERGWLLALGETTGHAHAVPTAPGIEVFQGRWSNEPDELLVPEGMEARVNHEEHGTVTLGPGLWEIGRVQAFDYTNSRNVNVID
jgi:hypothetical protein